MRRTVIDDVITDTIMISLTGITTRDFLCETIMIFPKTNDGELSKLYLSRYFYGRKVKGFGRKDNCHNKFEFSDFYNQFFLAGGF